MKEHEPYKEPARTRAERKWRNKAIIDKIREALAKDREPGTSEPVLGSIIPPSDPETINLARKYRERRLREIFSFLYEDMKRSVSMVALLRRPLSDEEMLHRLKLEKLRRLEIEYYALLKQHGESK